MSIEYRLHRAEDVPQLKRLWEEMTDWGPLTDEMWRHYMLEAPHGEPIVCVATETETGEIMGGMVFRPSLVALNGRDVRAVRPGVPIIGRKLRAAVRSLNPMHHPMIQMVKFCDSALRGRGISFAYMLPDPHWRLLLRLMPAIRLSSFPLWSISLPLPAPFPIDPGYVAGSFSGWGERVDRLWEKASQRIGCAVCRCSKSLRHKAGPPEYEVLGIEREGELVGLACSRQKGDRQWLICDLVAADSDALQTTLAAVCNFAHDKALSSNSHGPLVKTAILTTPALEPVVRSLGFQRDKYDFYLAVRRLDESIPLEALTPDRWYLSAND